MAWWAPQLHFSFQPLTSFPVQPAARITLPTSHKHALAQPRPAPSVQNRLNACTKISPQQVSTSRPILALSRAHNIPLHCSISGRIINSRSMADALCCYSHVLCACTLSHPHPQAQVNSGMRVNSICPCHRPSVVWKPHRCAHWPSRSCSRGFSPHVYQVLVSPVGRS